VLRKILGHKRNEITVQWSRMHNEELYDLYCSPDIIQVIKQKRMRLTGHVARMADRKGGYRVLVRKHEVKRLLGRPRHR